MAKAQVQALYLQAS